ncbi:hypothetical protein COOONC_22025 [Cooperia oncophora]
MTFAMTALNILWFDNTYSFNFTDSAVCSWVGSRSSAEPLDIPSKYIWKDLVDNTIRPTISKAMETEMSRQAFYDDVLRKGNWEKVTPFIAAYFNEG